MKQALPSPEILPDLTTENWQLRWQVLEIFHRARLAIRDHARGSRPQREHLHLGRRLAGLLHSPQDHNLHLIVTAAYFLGGHPFVLLVFQHLDIDDDDRFYPQIARVRKGLASADADLSLIDYFRALLETPRAVEVTTTVATELAVRLLEPGRALPLLLAIPDRLSRRRALRLLARTHPAASLNDLLLGPEKPGQQQLRQNPELLDFIAPPLTDEQSQLCARLAGDLLDTGAEEGIEIAARAILRLELQVAPERLEQLDDDCFPALALKAALGDPDARRKLAGESRSWRLRKRCRALAGLAGCRHAEALAILEKSARKPERRERTAARQTLGENPTPGAFHILLSLLPETTETDERRRLLELIARHPRAETSPPHADLLADWHDLPELYPALMECLETLGCGPRWRELVGRLEPPLSEPQREIALTLARFAAAPDIRHSLSGLLFDLDWGFSYQLFSLLRPHLRGRELRLLLRLLKEHEETSTLTISEKLTRVSDIPRFDDALALFLNRNPAAGQRLLAGFVNLMTSGELAPPGAIISRFNRHDPALRKLLLGTDDFKEASLESRLPLLYFQELLQQIQLPGGHALAAIVHRTRRYNGYFQTAIGDLLTDLIAEDETLQRTEALPLLQELLDLIRRRPHYDRLRAVILERAAAIRRRSRELKVHQQATRDRDLRIFQVRKNATSFPGPRPPYNLNCLKY